MATSPEGSEAPPRDGKPQQRFVCPADKAELTADYSCTACNRLYPVVNGIPVLLNESNSVFRLADYLQPEAAYGGASSYAGKMDRTSGAKALYRRLVRHLSEAPSGRRSFDLGAAFKYVMQAAPGARVLVIGAGDSAYEGDITYTDVAFGTNVSCIADAHDLPFPPASFDFCVANAVLEHVVDPRQCVDEIERVLRPGGFVYAETPFMQPVHMGAHDFTRFTYLGHRRLFRQFSDIQSGIAGGPWVSAAQTMRYCIAALSDKPGLKRWLKLIGLLGCYPVRSLDQIFRNNQSAYDSASAFYFFGCLQKEPLPDRELLLQYRGG